MTDTDFEIDPALDADLRRTLREVAATVTDDDGGTVVRLVTAPVPSGRGNRWAWLAAAAAAGVIAGASLTAVADRDTEQTDVPVATSVALDGFALSHSCLGLHGRVNSLDDGGAMVVFGPTAGRTRSTVLVSTDDMFFTCGVSTAGDAVLTDWSTKGLAPDPPSHARVRVLEMRAETSRAELVGPGRILIIGRAGVSVDTIDLELPDGATAAAQLQDGWFLVDARVPAGVPMTEARLEWRTTSGDVSSSRVDVLDDVTFAEACARRSGCVEDAVARLHDAAIAAGRGEQATILADRAVTDAERVASLTRFADCFNSADTGATFTVSGPAAPASAR